MATAAWLRRAGFRGGGGHDGPCILQSLEDQAIFRRVKGAVISALLLREPEQTASDRRVCGDGDIQRLAFMKHARQLGFSAIRRLVDPAHDPEWAFEHANGRRSSIARLSAIRRRIRPRWLLNVALPVA